MEDILDHEYPKTIELKSGFQCELRPLAATDEEAFFEFFQAIPERERMFIKHRLSERAVIQGWCQNLDYGRNLPLLAISDNKIIGDATLHQQLGGWKRHIGRVSVLIHPSYRGRGLAKALVTDLIEVARHAGLAKVEAEFIGEQEGGMKVFALLGFITLARIPDYVKDMQAISHDYILMGLDIKTDEEFAGME